MSSLFNETNAVAVTDYFGYHEQHCYIATAYDFADAITGTALAAKQNSAIFLVGDAVPVELDNFILGGMDSVFILGGPNAVSDDIEYELGLERWIPVTGVGIYPTELSLAVGQYAKLSAHIFPNNASNRGLFWSSGDEAVATVDPSGTVTAQREGTTSITVTTDDGYFTASCTIYVEATPATNITLNPRIINLNVGHSANLTAKVTPGGHRKTVYCSLTTH